MLIPVPRMNVVRIVTGMQYPPREAGDKQLISVIDTAGDILEGEPEHMLSALHCQEKGSAMQLVSLHP